MTNIHPKQAAQAIKKLAPNFTPEIGIILGSGLGSLANDLSNPIKIPYHQIPGFPVSTVQGHQGQLVLGFLNNCPVVFLQGRVHFYEGANHQAFKCLIRTLKLLGCHTLIMTNAAGSLRPEVGPGSISLITDHINFQPGNPLIGLNDEEFGPRFFSMDNAYDKDLRNLFLKAANKLSIPLFEGIYISTLGPAFETPAEIRAFRILGADLVGMSTVPDVLVARHCGLKVVAISAITNFAAGLSHEIITHENTLHYAQLTADHMTKLIKGFMDEYANNRKRN